MAIAYDNSTNNNTGGTPPTVTYAFTVGSNSNRVLVVYVNNNSVTASQIASVTYAGIAMTPIRRDVGTVGSGVGTVETFILINPATGTNNVVITQGVTKSSYIASVVGSYYEVDQTTGYDVIGYSESLTSGWTASATTTVDNTWGVLGAFSQRNLTASTNTTARVGSGTSIFLGDTNADQTPAGSKSMSLSVSSSPYTTWGHIVFLKPVGSGPAPTNSAFLAFM